MKKQKVAAAYAKALFQFARTRESVEEIGHQFDEFMQVWNEHTLLQNFFLSYTVSREEKEAKIENIFHDYMHPAFLVFFRFTIHQNHAGILPLIHNNFSRLQDDYFNKQRVKLISSFPLDDRYYQQFHTLLSRVLSQSIILTPVVDPEIIGGFIVSSDAFHIDCSIKRELEVLRKRFCLISNKGVKN